MKSVLPILILLTIQPPLRADGLPTRTSVVSAALADCKRLPHEQQLNARYLWYPQPAGDAKEAAAKLAIKKRVLATWVNFLSTEPDLEAPVEIAPGIYRARLDSYGWKAAVWERLLDVEPWFHADVVTVVKQDYGYYQDRNYPGRYAPDHQTGRANPGLYRFVKTETRTKTVKTRASAFTDPVQTAALIALTQTQLPVVRADWFLHQTAIQAGRKAGYYDFLNLGKKLQDFDDLVGANIKTSRRLRRAHRAIIGRSIVTLNNRGMEGGATLTEGIRMLTEDYIESADKRNPLRLLQGDAKPDGGEALGNLPNGLIAMWVQNGQGVRVDSVPDNIASDRTSRSPDRRVHAGMCMRCHEEGYRPIDDWARRVYRGGPFTLDSPDAKLQRELRAAYLSDLAGFLNRGTDVYALALKRAGGWTPKTWSAAFADEWSAYADEDRSVEDLARELGLDGKAFAIKLRAYATVEAKAGRKPDPVLAGLVQGIPARIEHVEELVPLLSQIGEAKP